VAAPGDGLAARETCVLPRARLRSLGVEPLLRYRGRAITPTDLAFLRALIVAHPHRSRRALSFAVCAAWQWRQPNGQPCDAVCRGLLLWLHRAGHVVLPPARWVTSKPWRPRTSAPPVLVDTSPLAVPLGETLSLVGGDVTITGRTLNAPSGQINVVSVASSGEVSLPNYKLVSGAQGGTVRIEGTSTLDVSDNAFAGDGHGGPRRGAGDRGT